MALSGPGESGARQAATTLAATLAGLGGAGIFAFLVSDRRFAGWAWWLAGTSLGVGLLILLVQATPALERTVTAPWHSYRRWREERTIREARYLQRLRCGSCGHVFEETVRDTPQGWLEFEGAVRTCPICFSKDGFESRGAIPLNKEAERLKAIPPPPEG